MGIRAVIFDVGGVLKPDREAYAIVCERLAVAPAQAVLVDDTTVAGLQRILTD